MSVFVLPPEEFGAIARTLHVARDLFQRPLFPLSMAERFEHKALVEPHEGRSEEDYALSLIDPFVFRLYLANAMAERYTYWKGEETAFTIPLFALPTSEPVHLAELLRLLDSLSYNLVTNGGNTFLGVQDEEKLRDVTDRVKTELIHGKH